MFFCSLFFIWESKHNVLIQYVFVCVGEAPKRQFVRVKLQVGAQVNASDADMQQALLQQVSPDPQMGVGGGIEVKEPS